MPVADLADGAEIAGRGGDGAAGGAAHRFGDEGDDAVRTQPLDRVLQLGGEPETVVLGRLAGRAPAIIIGGRDMLRLDQQRRILDRRAALWPTASAPSVLPW